MEIFMRFKKLNLGSFLLNVGLCTTSFANDLTIYVAKEVPRCISFNLVKMDQPTQVNNTLICPGYHGKFIYLTDGKYRLFGMEVDTISINPYGDSEYINSPLELSNDSGLAVYYPSRFTKINYQSNINVGYPVDFRLAN